MTTDERIAAIRKRLEEMKERADAAAPGPWQWSYFRGGNGYEHRENLLDRNGEPVVETDSGFYPPHGITAEFIASARTDLPALVAVCEAWVSRAEFDIQDWVLRTDCRYEDDIVTIARLLGVDKEVTDE